MTKPLPDMLALAERCEAATGPDRDIDSAIGKRGSKFGELPRYTASLDAAMTLVPEGAGVELNRYWVKAPGERWECRLSIGTTRDNDVYVIDRPTPALALCAAALRARATPPGPSGNQGG